MKFSLDIDCTPEELRGFFGMPEVKPMQERLLKEVEERMRANVKALDPETLLKTWLPAGLNPRPASGRVPVWFGGHHERTLERIAKFGDGWMPNAYPPDQSALDVFSRLRRLTEAAGRDPAKVGIEVWVAMGSGTEADWADEARFWKAAGASHLCLTTTFDRRHHKRIAGHTMADHLAALKRYHAAVADRL